MDENLLDGLLPDIDLIVASFSALMRLQGDEVRQTAFGPDFWSWRDMEGSRDFSIAPSTEITGGHVLTISQVLSRSIDSRLVYSVVITGKVLDDIQLSLTNATVIHSGAYAGVNSVVRVLANEGLVPAMQRCAEIVGKTLSSDLREILSMFPMPDSSGVN